MPPDMGEEKIYNSSINKNNFVYTKKQNFFVHMIEIVYLLIKLLYLMSGVKFKVENFYRMAGIYIFMVNDN